MSGAAKTERWIYLGRRWNGKAIRHAYVLETAPRTPEEEMWFGKALGTGTARGSDIIGGKYQFQVDRTGDGCVVQGDGKKYICMAGLDQEEMVALRSQDVAAEGEWKAQVRMKKDKGGNDMVDLLAPIREVYRRSPAPAKRALLAEVIRIITGGRA
jgi:hypothetical protein